MGQYEVVVRASERRRSGHDYVTLGLDSARLDRGMRLRRVDELPNGEIAIVLQHRLRPKQHDSARAMAGRSLAQLGIPVSQVHQIDLHRLSRKGRTLVRSWRTGHPGGPGPAGDREPRNPLPNPPHLYAARDLPES